MSSIMFVPLVASSNHSNMKFDIQECLYDSDCTEPNKEKCWTNSYHGHFDASCVQCLSDSDCTAKKPVCGTSDDGLHKCLYSTCSLSSGPCQCHDDSDCLGTSTCLQSEIWLRHVSTWTGEQDLLEHSPGFCTDLGPWTREHCSQKGRCHCLEDSQCVFEHGSGSKCVQGECAHGSSLSMVI